MTDPVLSIREAAQWFGVKPSAVQSWVRRNQLPLADQQGPVMYYWLADLARCEKESRNVGRHRAASRSTKLPPTWADAR